MLTPPTMRRGPTRDVSPSLPLGVRYCCWALLLRRRGLRNQGLYFCRRRAIGEFQELSKAGPVDGGSGSSAQFATCATSAQFTTCAKC